MDKVLPILEKYAQWIALGFGAVFLGPDGHPVAPGSALKIKVGTQTGRPGPSGSSREGRTVADSWRRR